MSPIGAIASLANATLTVTRTQAGTMADGIETPGTSATFTITASVQPLDGRELQALPEGERGSEIRVIYTTTELKTRTATTATDRVEIDGEPYEVISVATWKAWGSTHYRCLASRVSPT